MKKVLSIVLIGALTSAISGFTLAQDWKKHVPVPIYEDEPGLVELYWKAWEYAHDHVKEQEGLPQSPYMDEAHWTHTIWIWDTCFMTLFCRYTPDVFPGIESLNNFYVGLHGDYKGVYPLNIQHPDNPPLFAWAEYDYFKLTDDKDHIKDLLLNTKYLQKHFNWFNNAKQGWQFKSASPRKGGMSAKVALKPVEDGFFWSQYSSGMDKTARGRGMEGEILWLDALAQQGLSALCISRLANYIGEKEMAAEWKNKYEAIKKKINDLYWCEEDGIYYDIHAETKKFCKVKTPASFWPMLAEMCSQEQAGRLAEHAKDPETFGGIVPWPSMALSDPDCDKEAHGNYMSGGVWLPLAYMGTKALEKYGYQELADDLAERLVLVMLKVYKEFKPHTIWEHYSPVADNHPGMRRRKTRIVPIREDFCGWSALGPISMFIENIIGLNTIDAQQNKVEWRLRHDFRHGIDNLKFGDITTSLIAENKKNVTVTSNKPYTLVINGRSYNIEKGENKLKLETRN